MAKGSVSRKTSKGSPAKAKVVKDSRAPQVAPAKAASVKDVVTKKKKSAFFSFIVSFMIYISKPKILRQLG